MANVNNPRKKFNFSINLAGINPFLAQEVTSPDVEFDEVSHGDTNYDVKTAGKRRTGTVMVDKIFPQDSLDSDIDDWMDRIGNELTGAGQVPTEYKVTGFIEQFASDGVTVLKRTFLYGAWPRKKNGVEFSRNSSGNTTERIEFCVDFVK